MGSEQHMDRSELASLADKLLAQLNSTGAAEPESPEAAEARRLRDEEALRRDRERRIASQRASYLLVLPPKMRVLAAGGGLAESTEWPATHAGVEWWRAGCSRAFMIRGGVGVGKSVASAAVSCRAADEYARSDAAHGPAISWHRPDDFVSAVLHAYDSDAPKLGKLLVVIDDVGRETKPTFEEALCTFLDDHSARLLMTTNLTKDQFRERYGQRLIDRLREVGQSVTIKGESRRQQNGDF